MVEIQGLPSKTDQYLEMLQNLRRIYWNLTAPDFNRTHNSKK